MNTRRKKKHYRLRLCKQMLLLCIIAALAAIALHGTLLLFKTVLPQPTAALSQPTSSPEKSPKPSPFAKEKTYKKLANMLHKDPRIQKILDNYEKYPIQLLDMLTRNLAMLPFVLHYPQKEGKVYAETVGTLTYGEIPLLLQWDERWGYGTYGDACLAINGCAPTVLSMVITGLRQDNTITPYKVAQFAQEQGYYIAGTGSSWSLITDGSRHFGIEAKELPLSKSSVFTALENGSPIICSMRPGDFTTSGHFIVLTKLTNGKINVHDPNSLERSHQLWDYATLEKQIENLWACTAL